MIAIGRSITNILKKIGLVKYYIFGLSEKVSLLGKDTLQGVTEILSQHELSSVAKLVYYLFLIVLFA